MTMQEYSIRIRDSEGRVYSATVDRLPFWIGRGSENDIVLGEASVSKRHAYIDRGSNGLVIVDNGSRNGVVFHRDKQRVEGSRALQPDEVFLIGRSILKLEPNRALEIPADLKGADSITFFASRDTWDPLKVLVSSVAPDPSSSRPLKGSWQQLVPRLLLEASREGICEVILDMTAAEVTYDRCYVVLFENGSSDAISIAAKRILSASTAELILSRHLLRRVAQSREAAMVKRANSPMAASESFLHSGASEALCIPLLIGGEARGALYLDRVHSSTPLTEADLERLGPVAGLIALKLENLQLVQEQIASQLLQRDLELAKDIQESLLPNDTITLPGYAVDGHSIPCHQVGGDYFDVLEQEGRKAVLVIGDVSGKGLSSALYMACIRSCLHAHLVDGLGVTDLMGRLELHTRSTFRTDHFLTLFLGTLELDTGVLTYCNAGHMPALLIPRAGDPSELDGTAPALNIAPWGRYDCRESRLEPGDMLVLYTDGLVEAESPTGEPYGIERLRDRAARGRMEPLADLRQGILTDIDAFTGGARPRDDCTMILVRREEGR